MQGRMDEVCKPQKHHKTKYVFTSTVLNASEPDTRPLVPVPATPRAPLVHDPATPPERKIACCTRLLGMYPAMAPPRGRVAIAGRLRERPRASGSEALLARGGIFQASRETLQENGLPSSTGGACGICSCRAVRSGQQCLCTAAARYLATPEPLGNKKSMLFE